MSKFLSSMTGYGQAQRKIGNVVWVCQVRSLNHRFLECKVRLPSSQLLEVDTLIRKKVAEHFKRGAFEVSIQFDFQDRQASRQIHIDQGLTFWNQAKLLEKKLGSEAAPLTMDGLLRLPGVVLDASSDLFPKDTDIVGQLVEPALVALKESRNSEGEKLKTHLLSMIGELRSHLEKIKKLEPVEKERLKTMLGTRAEESIKLFQSISSSEDLSLFRERLRDEAVFWIDRRDFEEERVRFEMHLDQFQSLIEQKQQEPVGRKLEFIQQELLRETNTLGTKAQSQAITSYAIEMKSILERVREQLANVE